MDSDLLILIVLFDEAWTIPAGLLNEVNSCVPHPPSRRFSHCASSEGDGFCRLDRVLGFVDLPISANVRDSFVCRLKNLDAVSARFYQKVFHATCFKFEMSPHGFETSCTGILGNVEFLFQSISDPSPLPIKPRFGGTVNIAQLVDFHEAHLFVYGFACYIIYMAITID